MQLIGQVFPVDKLGDGVVQRLHDYLRPRPTRRHAHRWSRAQLVLARSSGRIVEDAPLAPRLIALGKGRRRRSRRSRRCFWGCCRRVLFAAGRVGG